MPGTKADELVRRTQIRDAAFELAAGAGLKAVTIRDVAERAGLSPGLVLFHFGSKEQLILALLDWVLETTTALRIGPDIVNIAAPSERLLVLLRQEMARLASEPLLIRLFFEFWSAGLWDPEIGLRMQRELGRYREAFRPITAALLAAEPDRFSGVTADSLAAVAVSIIKGCCTVDHRARSRFGCVPHRKRTALGAALRIASVCEETPIRTAGKRASLTAELERHRNLVRCELACPHL